jgi:hypothetical protein
MQLTIHLHLGAKFKKKSGAVPTHIMHRGFFLKNMGAQTFYAKGLHRL